MSLYIDTSVLVPLILPDALLGRAEMFRGTAKDLLIVSDLAAAEFSAVVGRRFRSGSLGAEDARSALDLLERWGRDRARRAEITSSDVAQASDYLRRFDLALSAPDAIHIAAALRLSARLVTFDRGMARAARALGAEIVEE